MFSHINFLSIGVTDQDRALAFYRDKLGLRVERDAPYEDSWRWIFLEIPGARTKLQFGRRANEDPTVLPDLTLVTDDVDRACETLKSRGVPIEKGPDNAPWDPNTRWAMIRDSENNLILIQTI
jgi:catechol 2,3-dioxygenase-like lactoylglutathione lyase family enzyme